MRIEEYESEETEVKKDIEWLKDEILTDMRYLEGNRDIQQLDFKYRTLREVIQKINQLDEPEVLSQEWIDENETTKLANGVFGKVYFEKVVPSHKLQNLLVPKQEEPTQEQVQKYLSEHGIEVVENEPETVADVVTTFWKSYERLKEVMSMQIEELEE